MTLHSMHAGREVMESVLYLRPWSIAATGDYDGDGKDDTVWRHTDGTHRLWLMHGLAIKGSATLVGPGSGWSVQP